MIGKEFPCPRLRRRASHALVAALCLLAAGVASGTYAEPARAEPSHLPAAASSSSAASEYVQQPCTSVYSSPDVHSVILTKLLGGTDVTPLNQTDVQGVTWRNVQFWSGLDGYIIASQLGAHPPAVALEGSCGFPGVPDPQSVPTPAGYGSWPLPAGTSGLVFSPAPVYAHPGSSAPPVATLTSGTAVQLLAWAGDSEGHTWYEEASSVLIGWLWSGDVALDEPNPALQRVKGRAIWMTVAGKGMWFTNYLPHHSNIDALVRAAKLAGVTYLYAEVAITQYGFYGQNTLDRLLPAAHAAGIAVIAWVYPDLTNIAADVRLTLEVADYVTKSGDRVDGVATDIEDVDDTATVYCYGQLVRVLLGADTLMVAAVYHPFAQPYYPYAAIAASWNVIAPMDYWHSRNLPSYSVSDVRRFVADSITTIRAAMTGVLGVTTNSLPVEELGQTYDMYSGDGTRDMAAPTATEIEADMQTARALGCIGVSFFEWQTTTQGEWGAIKQFSW
ncbi:MAG: hypothetical protein ACLQUY_09325 [Ktedonobacterales bacterium]